MMKRSEVEFSLQSARERKSKAVADLDANVFGSAKYEEARTRRSLWTGYICAYESVLQIDPEATS